MPDSRQEAVSMRRRQQLQSTPWLRGSLQAPEDAAGIGSRQARAIDIAVSSRTEGCIALVIGLACATTFGRWILNKFAHKNTVDASSVVDDYDLESGGARIVIDSTDLDVESGAGGLVSTDNDVESREAIRTSDDSSLPGEGENASAKGSHKSGSVLTMGASSSDDVEKAPSIFTVGSSSSDFVMLFDALAPKSGPSVSSGSVAAASAVSATRAAPLSSDESIWPGSSGEVSPLSMRTLSMPKSEGFFGLPPPSESDVQQCTDSSAGGNTSAEDEDEDDGNFVDHDVLMAALRGAGIMTGEGVGDQESVPHGGPEHSSLAQDENELVLRGREGETISTISVLGGEHAGEEGENSETEWDDLLIDSSSLGSMHEPVNPRQTEPGLAKERTHLLVKMLSKGPDMITAVLDIHMARHCNLDFSTSETNGDLKRDGMLGAGHYGRVSRVEHEPSGQTMAIKELTEAAAGEHQQTAGNEIDTFLCLGGHPNIIKILAVNSALPTMPVLMEHGFCDMVDVIMSINVSLSHKIGILHDAARGLLHVHESGKVHRDIKAGNIIVTVDKAGIATGKVADFGLTCDIGEVTAARTGTPGYLPAELLYTSVKAGPENDVFSFAVLMLEVMVLPELWENNMFAHSSLLSADGRLEFDAIAQDDMAGYLDLQVEVEARTLADGSFARCILQPNNLQRTVAYPYTVCGWLQACLCLPPYRRPSMASVVAMLQCLREGSEPPAMAMRWYM